MKGRNFQRKEGGVTVGWVIGFCGYFLFWGTLLFLFVHVVLLYTNERFLSFSLSFFFSFFLSFDSPSLLILSIRSSIFFYLLD